MIFIVIAIFSLLSIRAQIYWCMCSCEEWRGAEVQQCVQNSLDAHIKYDIIWRKRGGDDEDDDIHSNALICAHRE